jgi:hypothetical protein
MEGKYGLSKARIRAISGYLSDVAQVFFAGFVVEILIRDTISMRILVVGIVLSIICWFLSIILVRK